MNLDMIRIPPLAAGVAALALSSCAGEAPVLPEHGQLSAGEVTITRINARRQRSAAPMGLMSAATAPNRSSHMGVGITITGDEPDHEP